MTTETGMTRMDGMDGISLHVAAPSPLQRSTRGWTGMSRVTDTTIVTSLTRTTRMGRTTTMTKVTIKVTAIPGITGITGDWDARCTRMTGMSRMTGSIGITTCRMTRMIGETRLTRMTGTNYWGGSRLWLWHKEFEHRIIKLDIIEARLKTQKLWLQKKVN